MDADLQVGTVMAYGALFICRIRFHWHNDPPWVEDRRAVSEVTFSPKVFPAKICRFGWVTPRPSTILLAPYKWQISGQNVGSVLSGGYKDTARFGWQKGEKKVHFVCKQIHTKQNRR